MALPEADREQGAFLLLDPADNILVCTRDALAGDLVTIDGIHVRLPQPDRKSVV